jgi:hypothetical protein
VSKVVLSFSHERGKQQQQQQIYPKIKCNTVSVSPSASSVVVSSKEEKKKKGDSGDSFVNFYLRLWLTCLLCQPSAAAGFVYLEFSWMLVPFVFSSIQPYPSFAIALFLFFFNLQFTWGVSLLPPPVELSTQQPLLQAFPSPSTLGEDGATPAYSGWLVYFQFA